MRRLSPWIAGILLFVLVAACGSDAEPEVTDETTAEQTESTPTEEETATEEAAPETETVTVALAIPSFAWLPVYVADDLGFFGEQGIQIDEVALGGGAEAVSALLSGDIDAIATSGSHPLFLYEQDQEMIHLVALLNRFATAVVTTPDIPGEDGDISGLEGHTVGVSRPGSGGDQIVRSLLQRAGLDPESDVDIIAVGATDAQIAALQAGEVNAIVQTEPVITQATEEGWGRALVDFRRDVEEFPEFAAVPSTTIQVLPGFLEERGDLAERFVNAIMKAHCVIQERPEDAVPAAQAVFPNLSEDLVLQAILNEQSVNGPVYSEEGHEANVAFFQQAGLEADVPYEAVAPPAEIREIWESDVDC